MTNINPQMKCDSGCTLIVKNSGSFNDGDKVDTIYEIDGDKYNMSKHLTKDELGPYLSDINFICKIKDDNVLSKIPQIVPSVFNVPIGSGNFYNMIQDDDYYVDQQPLFIFNDNTHDHTSNRQGGGNAVIRPFKYCVSSIGNIYGHESKTCTKYHTAWGIPTASDTELTVSLKLHIDTAIIEIKSLITHYNITTIYYSAHNKYPNINITVNEKLLNVPDLGCGIFNVLPSVRTYIVTEIYKLQNDIIDNYIQKNLR